jgi:hypothetical protein
MAACQHDSTALHLATTSKEQLPYRVVACKNILTPRLQGCSMQQQCNQAVEGCNLSSASCALHK